MIRGLVCLILLGTAVSAAAETPETPPIPDTIKLTVRPAAAPSPALKYQFLPELREQTPGNAALWYYRAFALEWQVYRRPEVEKHIDAWLENPRKPPGKDLNWVLNAGFLKEIDLAARRSYCDWEMADRVRKEGIGMLLPDVQRFRSFSTLLAIRARLEMAEGHPDKAAATLKTGLTFARHVSDAPTLIQSLVGTVMASVLMMEVEELIQTPDGPNLYWALTHLPRPFIDLRKPYQGERLFVDNLFPGVRELLADPKAKPLPLSQIQATVDKLTGEWRGFLEGQGQGANEWQTRLQMAVLAARAYPEARRFLVSHGWTDRQVEAMPFLQVVVMYEVHNYDRFYDDMIKWQSLPYVEARRRVRDAELQLKQAKASGTGTVLASLLVPALFKVQEASVRLERRIDALRCVEAVRLYAAAHDGKLPASLSDIQEVPIPRDPMTGNAFAYRVEGNTAILDGPPPDGDPPTLGNTLRYEITLRR